MTLRFESLPLMEVIVRLAPETLLPFRLKTLSRYAAALEERFPEVEQLEQIHSGLVPRPFELGFGRLNGAVFSTADGSLSLTVQRDLVVLTWRRGKTGYPHFDALKDSLRWAVHSMREAEPDDFPSFLAANMSYANHITTPALPTGKDLLMYIRTAWLPPSVEDASVIHEQNLAWQDAQGVSLRLHFQGVIGGAEQPGPTGFYIKTVAGRTFDPVAWPDEQLESNHDALVDLFPRIITEEAARTWGMTRI